ncbi:MAG: hypothetical protein E7566_03855 [Ruminococcaceae bacterium]|nr:hypothetical protein [Oscillospiraceae bacterium]
MTKRIFALIIAVLMIATVFAACGDKKEDNKTTTATPVVTAPVATAPQTEADVATTDVLKGSWYASQDGVEGTYTFNGDGTGVIEMMGVALNMTYTIEGNKLTYTMTFAGESETQTLDFTVNGNELTLTDGIEPVVFTKKEGHVPATPTEFTLDLGLEEPTDNVVDFTANGGDIVGAWVAEEEGIEITYTFNADGTGSIDMMGIAMDMTYTTEGNTVTYTVTFEGESETETLEYSVVGNELTMTDGEYPVTFTKK